MVQGRQAGGRCKASECAAAHWPRDDGRAALGRPSINKDGRRRIIIIREWRRRRVQFVERVGTSRTHSSGRAARGDPHLDASTSGARTAASQSGAAATASVQSWSLHVERCQFMPHIDPQRTIRRAAKSNSYSTSTPTSRLLSTCCRLHRLQQQCCCRITTASALRRDAKEGCELGRFCRCGSHASGAYSQRMGPEAYHPCWSRFTEPA